MCGAIDRHFYAKKKCIIVKYAEDTRYNHLSKSGGMITHSKHEYSNVPIITAVTLGSVCTDGVDVIGVDEAQFYSDAPEIIAKWAKRGIKVIVAALDSTWQGKPFGRVAEIISLSDHVEKLNAVCMRCNADAPFTCKIAGNGSIEEIGGSDKYIAACRKCFIEINSFAPGESL
jgi:thymidine kinase